MNFTEEQLRIINSDQNSKLVVSAVPGSGKTRVLVARIQQLVSLGINPKSIAAITFTNNAAREMESRLGDCKIGYVGTIHKLMLLLIQKHWKDLGFGTPFVSPIDDDSFDAIVKDAIKLHNYKKPMCELVEEINSLNPASRAAEYVSTTMKVHGVITFDLIIRYGIVALKSHVADIGFSHIMLDEAQDTSDSDAELFGLMAAQAHGAMVVGDPNQSIYGFRGGSPEFMNRLIADKSFEFAGLTKTFRCTQQICSLANSMTQIYEGLADQQMQSDTSGPDVSTLSGAGDEIVSLMVRTAKGSIESNAWKVAILARMNSMVSSIREAAITHGLKVSRKYSRSEDWTYCTAALTALFRPECPIAWIRYLSLKMGTTEAKSAIRKNESSFLPVSYGHFPQSIPCDCSGYDMGHVSSALAEMGVSHGAIAVFQSIIERSKSTAPDDILMECCNLIDGEDDSDLFIGTIHSAKGLEFDHVIVAPFVPTDEETARLLYVAATRAKTLLTMCSTQ